MQPRRSRRQIEHVAFAEQRFRAVGIENGARVNFAGHAEGNARGEIGFDQAGDDVHRRPLRGEDQVDAHRASHLRQARDGFLDAVGIHHHQVGQFVNHDHDVGKRAMLFFLGVFKERKRLPFLECAVVLLDIAHAALREQLQAALHFARGVAQDVGRDFRVGDDRRVKVRDVGVKAQLEPLRIHQHELQFVGRGFVEHAHQQGIDEDAFAGAGGAGDQQVRHLGQVRRADAADQVFSERQA